jgi:hypothetical protein
MQTLLLATCRRSLFREFESPSRAETTVNSNDAARRWLLTLGGLLSTKASCVWQPRSRALYSRRHVSMAVVLTFADVATEREGCT